MTIASPDPNVELAPAILFQTERVVSTLPTSASLRSAARASKPAPPPPPPAVGASFSGARFSSSSRFHHPRSTLCHPVRACPHRSAPPQRGQALTEAPRAPRAMRPLFTPYESAPVTHGALPLHRPPRRPNSPSAHPLIGPDARRPAGPLTTTTYGTPEPGYLTLSFASDARLAVLPESSHHLLHGLPRRHSSRI